MYEVDKQSVSGLMQINYSFNFSILLMHQSICAFSRNLTLHFRTWKRILLRHNEMISSYGAPWSWLLQCYTKRHQLTRTHQIGVFDCADVVICYEQVIWASSEIVDHSKQATLSVSEAELILVVFGVIRTIYGWTRWCNFTRETTGFVVFVTH